MLTRNFYSHMRATMQGVSVPFTLFDGTDYSVTAEEVTKGTIKPFSGMARYFPDSGSTPGINFGTGRTAPKVTDFRLEEPIDSGLTVTTPSAVSYNRTDEYEEYVATYGVTANETVTISEIGLGAHVQISIAPYKNALMDRTVLETPITIPAGETKQITYTIRFNYPTA